MSWQSYIENLKAIDKQGNYTVEEAAICGMESGSESVWASTPGMSTITPADIKKLAGDRRDFFQCGPHIAGIKCRMLRDNLDTDMHTMDLKTSADCDGNSFNVCVGKSNKALVIVKGTKDANGGQLSSKVFEMVEYLRKSGL